MQFSTIDPGIAADYEIRLASATDTCENSWVTDLNGFIGINGSTMVSPIIGLHGFTMVFTVIGLDDF